MNARLLPAVGLLACLSILSVATPASLAEAADQKEDVLYRTVKWQAKHIHDAAKADKIAVTLKKLGCQLKRAEHDGHIDLSYHCPKWKKLSLKTHAEAHQWEKWLKEYGFQTQHQH
jgi:hypothetical protein